MHCLGETRIPAGKPHAAEDEAVAGVRELGGELKIPPLSDYGMKSVDVTELVKKWLRPAA